jgi:bifunctional pyridoxal-dependent enzyme with beta-cystathionase and maltose regulon repressor activities
VLDETLAAALIENREAVLSARRILLANGRSQVANWVADQQALIAWVKPDGGALCCLRLNPTAFDDKAVGRFWAALPGAELQIGNGSWFGESSSVLRLGFGYLPLMVLPSALEALSEAMDVARGNAGGVSTGN